MRSDGGNSDEVTIDDRILAHLRLVCGRYAAGEVCRKK